MKNGCWLARAARGRCRISTMPDPLSENVLLGVLALRSPGKRLEWNSANLKLTNAPELDAFIKIVYRNGWTV